MKKDWVIVIAIIVILAVVIVALILQGKEEANTNTNTNQTENKNESIGPVTNTNENANVNQTTNQTVTNMNVNVNTNVTTNNTVPGATLVERPVIKNDLYQDIKSVTSYALQHAGTTYTFTTTLTEGTTLSRSKIEQDFAREIDCNKILGRTNCELSMTANFVSLKGDYFTGADGLSPTVAQDFKAYVSSNCERLNDQNQVKCFMTMANYSPSNPEMLN